MSTTVDGGISQIRLYYYKTYPSRRPLMEVASLEHLTKHGGYSAGQSTTSLTTVTTCITWERYFFNLVSLGSFLGLYILFIC